MRRFEEAGLNPRTRHGQNFLIDLNLLRLLAESGQLGPDDVVLEVGSGLGSLTKLMAPQCAAVVTVEIDSQLFQMASEELFGLDNVTMLQTDALRNKNNFNPQVLEAVRAQLDAAPTRRFKLVANLPYNVATPIITNALALERPPELMAVTIQKELADRILARPSTKDYGSLCVWVQSQCQVELVRAMSPQVFWPRPKVDSAIIRITLDHDLRLRVPDLPFFHKFVRAIFWHRRKFLRSVAQSAFKNRLSKAEVDDVLAEQNMGPQARAEELDLATLLALCEAFRARMDADAAETWQGER